MVELIENTLNNMDQIGCGCIMNPKYDGFIAKKELYSQQHNNGFRIFTMQKNKKFIGFIECVPAEYAWRPIEAPDTIFIECIWIKAKNDRGKGYSKQLIQKAIEYAKETKRSGVSVTTSEKGWIAGQNAFLQLGFTKVDERNDFALLYYPLTKNPRDVPQFRQQEPDLAKYRGLNILYTKQCPFVSKMIPEYLKITKDHGFDPNLIEINDPTQIKGFPSLYGVFCMVYNGKILADHYISKTRLINILTKEIE